MRTPVAWDPTTQLWGPVQSIVLVPPAAKTRRGFAGIPWMSHSLFSAEKVGLEVEVKRYLQQKELLERVTASGKFFGTGWLDKPNERRLAEKFEYLFPGSLKLFDKLNTGKRGYGEALAHRGRMILKNQETLRYQRADLLLFYQTVSAMVEREEPVLDHVRHEIHEKVLLGLAPGFPGVYLFRYPYDFSAIYLGQSADLKGRVTGRHEARHGGGLRLVRMWTTDSAAEARKLEKAIHRKLEQRGRELVESIPTEDSEGYYKLVSGVDGLEVIDTIVDRDFPEFFRAKLGFDILL